MIICITLISTAANSEVNNDLGLSADEKQYYTRASIGLALCGACMLALKHILIRKFSTAEYPPLEVQFDAGILEFALFSAFYPVLATDGDVTWDMISIGTMSGVAIFSGCLFVNLTIAEGHAAVAEQLISTFSIWQTILSLEFDG